MNTFKTNNPKKLINFFLSIVAFSFILNFSLISNSHSNDIDEPYVLCATAPAGTVYSGSNVRIYQEEDHVASGENRDEILHGTKMQANEIWLDFQTKTRRSRGAWR